MLNPLVALGTAVEAARARAHNVARERFVRKHIRTGAIGAELGVHKGYFTEVLLRAARPARLHLVDPWYLGGTLWTWGRGNRSTVDGLRRVLDVSRDGLATGAVQIHVGGDLEFLEGLPDAALDWAYVDTTHAYDHTCRELQLLHVKVKSDGTIAGDDWRSDPGHKHHGVCKAVREFVASAGYEITHASDDDNQWAIRRARQA